VGEDTIAEYVYRREGARDRVVLGNGTYSSYAYDALGHLSSVMHYRLGEQWPFLDVQYPVRDELGNPLVMTDSSGTTSYTYDLWNRLWSATYPGQQPVVFGHDWVGNRLEPGGMLYNSADQLLRWPGEHRYEYSMRGDLVEVKDDSTPPVTQWSTERAASAFFVSGFWFICLSIGAAFVFTLIGVTIVYISGYAFALVTYAIRTFILMSTGIPRMPFRALDWLRNVTQTH